MSKIKKIIASVIALGLITVSFAGCEEDKSSSKLLNSNVSTGDKSSSSAEDGLNLGGDQVGKIELTFDDIDIDSSSDGNSGGSSSSSSSQGGNSSSSSSSSSSSQGGDSSSSSSVTNSNGSSSNSNSGGNASSGNIKGYQAVWLDVEKGSDFVFDGSFLKITFKVNDNAKDGVYPINITTADFGSYAGKTLKVNTVNGSVTVGDASSSGSESSLSGDFDAIVSQEKAAQGDEVTVNISLSNNPGFAGFHFVVSYDADALTIVNGTYGDDFQSATKY